MIQVREFERDFEKVLSLFPKLSYFKETNKWIVKGELDICDSVGVYWGTFEVAIYLPSSYPYCVPEVRELSNNIIRDNDWHISSNGQCCVDIEHRMLLYEKKGVNVFSFLKEKVYPYFANQIYKQNKSSYANGEYQHGFAGVVQYYKEDLGIFTAKDAISILEAILNGRIPKRYEDCICGSGEKFKKCHLNSVELLRLLPVAILRRDLFDFYRMLK